MSVYWGLSGRLRGLASLLGARRGRSSPQCNSAPQPAGILSSTDATDSVRLPLDPQNLLVLTKTGPSAGRRILVEPKQFAEVNAETAARCSRFIVAVTHRSPYLEALPLTEHEPTMRFNIAPGVRKYPSGEEQPISDIIQMWTPRY